MGRLSETPILANKVLAMASAVFTWGVKQEIVTVNPCRNVDRNKTTSRERVLSDSELSRFWAACGKYGIPGLALKLILILGQRPGEVSHMRFEHVVDGWWMLPGEVIAPGTKNGCSHRVWLPKPAQDILSELKAAAGFVLTGSRGRVVARLDRTMSAKADANRARAAAPATLAPASDLGLTLAPAPERPGTEHRGVLVIGIDPTGRAADLGVETGDIILEAGGKPVQAPEDIGNALDAARGAGHHAILMRLKSGDGMRFVAVPVDPA
jgi:hypothetical protein